MQIDQKILDTILGYLPRFGTSLLILILGWWIIKLILKAVKKILKRSRLDPTAHKILLQSMDVALKIVLFLTVLSNLGVDTTSVITLIGAAGLAVSLALQNSLSNFAGGIMILVSHPFHKGDFIEANGVSGKVEAINLWSTKLSTPDNKAVFVPNGELSGAKIINYSMEESRRLDITVPIGYNDDIRMVRHLLTEILEEDERTLREPAPMIGVKDFGDSAVEMTLRVWVKNEDYWDLYFSLLERIKIVFDENGVTIPYKQMDVTIKGVDKNEKDR